MSSAVPFRICISNNITHYKVFLNENNDKFWRMQYHFPSTEIWTCLSALNFVQNNRKFGRESKSELVSVHAKFGHQLIFGANKYLGTSPRRVTQVYVSNSFFLIRIPLFIFWTLFVLFKMEERKIRCMNNKYLKQKSKR